MQTIRNRMRAWLDAALGPLTRVLMRAGISPNQVTLSSVVISVVAAVLIVRDHLLAGALVFLFASTLDLVDGLLARRGQATSQFGAFLDSTLDRVSEGVVFAAIAYHLAEQGRAAAVAITVLALLSSLMVSYARARAEGLGLACQVGIVTRAERVLLITLGLATGLLLAAMVLLALLGAVSSTQRVVHVFRHSAPRSDRVAVGAEQSAGSRCR